MTCSNCVLGKRAPPCLAKALLIRGLRNWQAASTASNCTTRTGYFASTFFQEGTNCRADAYGGTIRNRVRFLLELGSSIVGVGARPRRGAGVPRGHPAGFSAPMVQTAPSPVLL